MAPVPPTKIHTGLNDQWDAVVNGKQRCFLLQRRDNHGNGLIRNFRILLCVDEQSKYEIARGNNSDEIKQDWDKFVGYISMVQKFDAAIGDQLLINYFLDGHKSSFEQYINMQISELSTFNKVASFQRDQERNRTQYDIDDDGEYESDLDETEDDDDLDMGAVQTLHGINTRMFNALPNKSITRLGNPTPALPGIQMNNEFRNNPRKHNQMNNHMTNMGSQMTNMGTQLNNYMMNMGNQMTQFNDQLNNQMNHLGSQLNQMNNQMTMDNTQRMGSMGSMTSMGNMGNMGNMGSMGSMGSMGNMGNMGGMGSVGGVGSIGNMGSMGNMGNMANMASMGSMGNMGSMGSMGSMGNMGNMSGMSNMGSMGSMGSMRYLGGNDTGMNVGGGMGSMGNNVSYGTMTNNRMSNPMNSLVHWSNPNTLGNNMWNTNNNRHNHDSSNANQRHPLINPQNNLDNNDINNTRNRCGDAARKRREDATRNHASSVNLASDFNTNNSNQTPANDKTNVNQTMTDFQTVSHHLAPLHTQTQNHNYGTTTLPPFSTIDTTQFAAIVASSHTNNANARAATQVYEIHDSESEGEEDEYEDEDESEDIVDLSSITPLPAPGTRNTVVIHTEKKRTIVAHSESDDSNTCKICFEAQIDTALIECGHSMCCQKCAVGIVICPICRQHVSRVLKIFRS